MRAARRSRSGGRGRAADRVNALRISAMGREQQPAHGSSLLVSTDDTCRKMAPSRSLEPARVSAQDSAPQMSAASLRSSDSHGSTRAETERCRKSFSSHTSALANESAITAISPTENAPVRSRVTSTEAKRKRAPSEK